MRTLAALALVFSVQAYACPSLTGSYTCTYPNGSAEQMNVSQDLKGTVTVYKMNGSTIPADNQAYQIPDDGSLKQGTFKAWCDDDITLKGLIVGKYYNAGQYYGDVTLNIGWSLSGNDLKESQNGQVVNTGGTSPISQDSVCTKN